MDASSLITALLSTQGLVLPPTWLFRLYLGLGWGAVLAVLALAWLRQRGHASVRLQRWLPLVLLLWCLLPGPWSPAYWLGLALRAPSGLLLLLCGWSLWRQLRPQVCGGETLDVLRPATGALALLGWVLLLDTLALAGPFSLYAWGYAPLTLGLLALLGLLPALLWGQVALPGLWLGALLLHLVLRLPTGNVWDAVLDPGLWLWLQLDWLRRWRRHA